ncbi:MAG: LysR family transcriptional regulator [Proteobacteria bacterium]|nr:LysR family transcriptional regulator [Pseudomonadota bacterium]
MTVPAVSRRVQILERHLGVQLFHRLPRGLALTAAGEKYFADLGPAWDALQKATAAAVSATRRPFRISVIPTFAANWLLPRLAARRARLPGREIELETSADFVDLEARQDLDCAIRLGRGPWPGLVSRRFLPIEAYPVASPAFLAGKGRIERPRDLLRHTLVGSTHQPDFWPEWFRLVGGAFAPASYKSYDNLQLVYEASAAGMGVAIGLDPLVRPYLANGRLVRLPVAGAVLSRSFHIVRRKGQDPDRGFEAFRDWLFRHAGAAA